MGPFRVTQPNPTHGQLWDGVYDVVHKCHPNMLRVDLVLVWTLRTTCFYKFLSSICRNKSTIYVTLSDIV